MKVAILGFDTEGKASYEYFKARGDELTICDQNAAVMIPAGASGRLGDHYLDDLDQFDLLVRTPGLHPTAILDKNPTVAGKITSGTNQFFAVCPTKKVIGITGTKGKGTTSTLVTKMLEAAGKRVHLGGNIGVAALSMLPAIQPDDWVVLELSNFQLIDLRYSPSLATCLMVVPEHLNWHADMAEYVGAKQQLFGHQTAADTAIYFAGNPTSREVVSAGKARFIPYYAAPGAHIEDDAIVIEDKIICKTKEVKLLGAHNWQNACAAVTTAWQVTQDIEAMRSVLTSFSGLEHRLEFVRELDDVRYYDDSFGTTPETAIVAIEAFEQPKVVILGGSDKGASYAELAKVVAATDVTAAVVIGVTAPAIAEALRAAGFDNIIGGGSTMAEIVQTAREAAGPGSVILLSTGCASFDLFKNYKDRGNQFKQQVKALA